MSGEGEVHVETENERRLREENEQLRQQLLVFNQNAVAAVPALPPLPPEQIQEAVNLVHGKLNWLH